MTPSARQQLEALNRSRRESGAFAAKEDNLDWDADKAYLDCADELSALVRAFPLGEEGEAHEKIEP